MLMLKTGVRLAGAMLAMTATIMPVSAANAQYLQCVPFARMISGVELFGRAASWWHQAIGRYDQGSLPRAGAVLVFKAISSMRSGHVATVSRVYTACPSQPRRQVFDGDARARSHRSR